MNEQERIRAQAILDEAMENLTPWQERIANIGATIVTASLFALVVILVAIFVFAIGKELL